jgi:hypothetical protein
MKTISTDSRFAAILNEDRAILFIDVAWSKQSSLSAAVIAEWKRTSSRWGLDFSVFRVSPDSLRSVADWMKKNGQQLKSEAGNGSLVWLRSKTIVDFEPSVLGAGLREISRRTRAAFRRECPGASPPMMWDRELDG